MTPPKLKCPKCGKKMQLGKRVQVLMTWEVEKGLTHRKGRSTLICRSCANKISQDIGLEGLYNV